MRLNNKGLSLMELLISIVLISIVLVFLFTLLVDLKNETENNNFAYNNQINRTEVIYTIQKDLNNYTLIGVEDNSINNNININFYYRSGDGTKTANLRSDVKQIQSNLDNKNDYYLRYTSFNEEEYSWKMKGASIDPCGLFTYYFNSYSKTYYFKFNIYLYNYPEHDRNNKERNNAVDDIEITYSGNKSDLILNDSYLTNNKTGEKKIGSCTN